jgi:hypothetical protein
MEYLNLRIMSSVAVTDNRHEDLIQNQRLVFFVNYIFQLDSQEIKKAWEERRYLL